MSASFAIAAEPVSVTQLTGAEIVVRALERQRIDIVAGVPGGAALPLYDALARCTRIRHVLARHEQAAGFMAQGIARITRRAGVCIATSGPGVTNLVTAIADAKADSVPLVVITGQVPQHLIGTDAFQEVATMDLARPITKAAWMAKSADELDELIAEAFHIAESGRQGPVWIDIPKDVQLQRCAGRSESRVRMIERLPRCHDALHRAAAMIDQARRPILYVGGGVVKARAEYALRRLAEQADIPVAMTLMALGAIPHDHPLCLGMLGMHGAVATNRALHECDVLIAIGARFDDRATGEPKQFAPRAQVIHIDSDAREFGKIVKPDLIIHADAWTAITALVGRVKVQHRDLWRQAIAERQESLHPAARSAPLDTIAEIGGLLPKDAILTTDVGQHQMWVAQAYPFARADRWLTSGGLGTMGFGLPAAIGAALAEPDAPVVCFTGDGSLLMNIQELATLAELQLNVKIVLLDNGGFGLVEQQQALFYGRRWSASRFIAPSDFVSIARSFGIAADDLTDTAMRSEMLRSKLHASGPMLIRIPIERGAMVWPMVAPGGANIDALVES